MSLPAKGSLLAPFFVIALSCATRSIVDPNGSGGSAGASGGTGGASGTGGTSGGAGGASSGGQSGSAGSAGSVSVDVPIANDDDDVVWVWTQASGWKELSQAGPNSNVLQIKDDPTTSIHSAGLRFQLDIPPGATIKSARLELDGGASPTNGMSGSDSLAVTVFEPDVPFSPGVHTHQPSDHGTLSKTEVVIQYSLLGNIDVTALLQQRVASAAGWKANDFVGFHVAARDAGTRLLNLGDTGTSVFKRANLHVTYVP